MMRKLSWRTMTIYAADTYLTRLRGLIGRRPLTEAEGLWIIPCNGVHMMGMSYAIDVVYLDKNGRILKLVRKLLPWLGLSCCPKAHSALELKAGQIDRLGLKCGEQVEFGQLD